VCPKTLLISQADPEPFFTEPGKHLIWFVYRRFGVILKAVREVFVDATFGTNSLGAHFYCILGQENGWFVPLAYMLLEAKQKEKTNDSSPDVTECVAHFFAAAQRKGLDPHFVYVDKCFSEINAAKVNPLNPIRAFNMNSNFINTNLCGFLFFGLCIYIILTSFITCALKLICRLQLLGPTHNPAYVRGTYIKLSTINAVQRARTSIPTNEHVPNIGRERSFSNGSRNNCLKFDRTIKTTTKASTSLGFLQCISIVTHSM
jgi:hypothetical protein